MSKVSQSGEHIESTTVSKEEAREFYASLISSGKYQKTIKIPFPINPKQEYPFNISTTQKQLVFENFYREVERNHKSPNPCNFIASDKVAFKILAYFACEQDVIIFNNPNKYQDFQNFLLAGLNSRLTPANFSLASIRPNSEGISKIAWMVGVDSSTEKGLGLEKQNFNIFRLQ